MSNDLTGRYHVIRNLSDDIWAHDVVSVACFGGTWRIVGEYDSFDLTEGQLNSFIKSGMIRRA